LDKRKYLKEVIELIRALNNRLVEEYTVAKVKYDNGEYEIDIIVKTVDEQNKISYQVLCFTPWPENSPKTCTKSFAIEK